MALRLRLADECTIPTGSEEKDPVVADAEAEFGAWRLELDDVASAGGEVAIDGLENPHGRLPANGAESG